MPALNALAGTMVLADIGTTTLFHGYTIVGTGSVIMRRPRPTLLLIALLLAAASSRGQGNAVYAWRNFAGQPGGRGNADGAGSAARFSYPTGVAVDTNGNVYAADSYNNTIRKATGGGRVTTLAGGTGQAGSADGVGGAARFSYPSGVAVDGAGNVYVADTYNHTIRKVTGSGVVTTLAGTPGQAGSADGTGGAALFNGPGGVAVDSAGNVYVADSGNSTIRKVTGGGVVTTLAGTPGQSGSADGTGGAAQFYDPSGVAVDGGGNVYVADLDKECIRKVTSAGVVTTLAGSAIRVVMSGGVVTMQTGSADGAGAAAQFYDPYSVAVDGAGNVYVADSGNSTLRKVTSGGVVTTLAGSPGQSGSADGAGGGARFDFPHGVAVDGAGNVYVADSGNSTLRKMTGGGMVTTLAGSAGQPGSADSAGSAARFDQPYGAAVDSMGNVYVADTYNHTLRKVTSSGMVVTLAGTPGQTGSADGVGSAARFSYPSGVAVDSAGNVYVADFGNSTLRKVTSGGVVTTPAGSAGRPGGADGAGSAARFNGPYGVAVDSAGRVYVADAYNSTIRLVTSNGVVTTLAGTPGQSGSMDGVGGAARFYYPSGVAVDGAGNVYVADFYNEIIRRVTSDGVVTTLAGSAGRSGSADGPGGAARFNGPLSVGVDIQGNVYVADGYNSTIRMITSGGTVTTWVGTPGQSGSADGTGGAARFYYPSGVAVDGAGNVYVADSGNSTIRLVTSGGAVTTPAGTAGQPGSADVMPADARFNGPMGVAVDGMGGVYVADSYNDTLRKVTSGGVATTPAGTAGLAGSTDGPGGAARFYLPSGVAVDTNGNVYVADTYNSTLRKMTISGLVTTLAGSAGRPGSADGAGSAALFNGPSGVAVDGAGNVYVADSGNSTLRKVSPGGVVTTLAGTPGQSGSADGAGGAALFNGPNGVAVDGAGNLYVADSGNSTIRLVTGGGRVMTLAGSAGQSGSADGAGGEARFDHPYGVAVDRAGNLYVTDSGDSTIRLVTGGDRVSTIGGAAGVNGGADGVGALANFAGPSGIAVDGVGRLYVADAGNNRISVGTPLPLLSILRSSVNVIVSWPAASAGFGLQQSADPGSANGWSNAIYSINDNGINKSVMLPSPTGNLFFRLIAN